MTRPRGHLPAVSPPVPANLCYQMHSSKSPDNGVTWTGDQTTSDVASPLPLQGDPGIQPTYAGDYDYGSAVLTKHSTSWTDGRVIHQRCIPAGCVHR